MLSPKIYIDQSLTISNRAKSPINAALVSLPAPSAQARSGFSPNIQMERFRWLIGVMAFWW